MRTALFAASFNIPVGVVAGVFLLVVLCAGLSLLAMYVVWRRGFVRGWRASRGAGPRCPGCGYNVSGLKQCRCPECGREFSLDEVVVSVPDAIGTVDRKP